MYFIHIIQYLLATAFIVVLHLFLLFIFELVFISLPLVVSAHVCAIQFSKQNKLKEEKYVE